MGAARVASQVLEQDIVCLFQMTAMLINDHNERDKLVKDAIIAGSRRNGV